jgi:hypothetical protein
VALEKSQPLATAVGDIKDERSRVQSMFQDLDASCNLTNRNWLAEILAEKCTIYNDNDKENNGDDDDYLPAVENILYTALHMEGFAMEDSSPDHTARGMTR